MKSIIPEKRVVTCDICTRNDSQTHFKTTASVKIDRAGLDFQGCPVGPGGTELDLCDDCVYALEQIIRDAAPRKSFVRHGGS
jgi:hypothetical protein